MSPVMQQNHLELIGAAIPAPAVNPDVLEFASLTPSLPEFQ
jgi:hypothetical protein